MLCFYNAFQRDTLEYLHVVFEVKGFNFIFHFTTILPCCKLVVLVIAPANALFLLQVGTCILYWIFAKEFLMYLVWLLLVKMLN